MNPTNPYAAPAADVRDVADGGDDAQFIPVGRSVGAGRGAGWIGDGWRLFRQAPGTWIGLLLVFVAISIAISIVPIAGSIAMVLLGPVFFGGIMFGADTQRRGGNLEIGHLFAGFRKAAGRLIGVGAISLLAYILIFVLILFTFGAGMAGMMSGMSQPTPAEIEAMGMRMLLAVLVMMALSIPVYMAIFFASPLITLNGFGVGAALRTSFIACLKNILPFLIWGIVFVLLAIPATLPLLLGWLVLGPVMLAACYTAYRDIFYAA